VHIASVLWQYQVRILDVATPFAPEFDGVWSMAAPTTGGTPDLYFIKTANTGSGRVEFYAVSGGSQYQARFLDVASTFAPESDGTWLMADYTSGSPDLVFVKTANTPSAEIRIDAVGSVGFWGSYFAYLIVDRVTPLTP